MSYKEGLDEYLIVVQPYFFTEVFTESIKNVDMTKIKKIIQRNPKLDCNTALTALNWLYRSCDIQPKTGSNNTRNLNSSVEDT